MANIAKQNILLNSFQIVIVPPESTGLLAWHAAFVLRRKPEGMVTVIKSALFGRQRGLEDFRVVEVGLGATFECAECVVTDTLVKIFVIPYRVWEEGSGVHNPTHLEGGL